MMIFSFLVYGCSCRASLFKYIMLIIAKTKIYLESASVTTNRRLIVN